MAMDDRVWRRHANPWSGWTRVTVLPLLVLAIWSRVWIGWWACSGLGLWSVDLAEPAPLSRAARPRRMDDRGVLGERVFLEHRGGRGGHVRAAKLLSWLSLPGAILMVWGLWALWWEGAVFGMILALLPKLWFLDRMVWVHRDWVAAGRAVPGYRGRRMEGGGMAETIASRSTSAAWRGWC
jgi:hypothetical protein